MVVEFIHNLYQYNAWANTRILDTATQLTPNQLQAPSGASFDSAHATLIHILSAQWLWLMRWQGHSPLAMLDPHAFPDLNSLRLRWEQVECETHDFVAACTESDLARGVTYRNFKNEEWTYPLWQQMLHQANHATQHRGEVAMILTGFNCSPGSLDFLYFIDAQSR
jgi:uncharacterized damage-inducible protein DinB